MPTLRERYTQTRDFILHRLWQIDLAKFKRPRRMLYGVLRIVFRALQDYGRDKCSMRGSALTLYSLLAVVPVLAMGFGIAKGFGLEELLEARIRETFGGQEDIIEQLIGFSEKMLQTTQGGFIAGIGLLVLFWTVLRLLNSIEDAFNQIWRIKHHRSILRKFTDYVTLIITSPILIVLSGSVTVFIATTVNNLTREGDMMLIDLVSDAVLHLLQFSPYVINWLLFALLFIIMPNTNVNIRAALIAGVLTGTLYQITQAVYINFQVGVSRYNAIYGGFAALPLFLIWLQLSWFIILFGAEVAFAIQHMDGYQYEENPESISYRAKRHTLVVIMHLIIQRFGEGKTPYSRMELSHELGLPTRLTENLVDRLLDAGQVVEVNLGEEKDLALQPAQDIQRYTIQSVLGAIDQKGHDKVPHLASEAWDKLGVYMADMRQALDRSPSNQKLAELEV